MSAVYDESTAVLESYYNSHGAEILANRAMLEESICAPLLKSATEVLRGKNAQSVIDECLERAALEFEKRAQIRGIDDWIFVIRRAPAVLFRSDWRNIAMRYLCRFSKLETDTTVANWNSENVHYMAHALTEDVMVYADQLGLIAHTISGLQAARRWVSKGATLNPSFETPISWKADEEIHIAVQSYEDRRPSDKQFFAQGLWEPENIEGKDLRYVSFATSCDEIRLEIPSHNMTLMVNFIPVSLSLDVVFDILKHYDIALRSLYGIDAGGIAHVLGAVSAQLLNSIVPLQQSGHGTLIADLSEKSDRLEFTYRLLRMGLMRLPREDWISAISAVGSPWRDSDDEKRKAAEAFFDAFTIDSSKSQKLDLQSYRPHPLLIKAPTGQYYFDFTRVADFAAWVLEGAKTRLKTQHGDLFHVIVADWVRSRVPGVRILAHDEQIKDTDGSWKRPDIVLAVGGRIVVVECKAFSLTENLFKGDLDAFYQRTTELEKAVKQAEAGAEMVTRAIGAGIFQGQPNASIESVVCTPSQQYIRPVDRFGWLAAGIPRVCTPEELCRGLSSE